MQLTLDGDVVLTSLTRDDAATLVTILDANRDAFDPWLRWSSPLQSQAAALSFIVRASAREATRDGFHLGIRRGGELIGGVVCWYIQREHRNAEIGYWLVPEARGTGMAQRATARVIQHLFEDEGLHRLELQCAVDNVPSRKLAERLGFKLEGIRRQSHWLGTRFADHAVYGLLAADAT